MKRLRVDWADGGKSASWAVHWFMTMAEVHEKEKSFGILDKFERVEHSPTDELRFVTDKGETVVIPMHAIRMITVVDLPEKAVT